MSERDYLADKLLRMRRKYYTAEEHIRGLIEAVHILASGAADPGKPGGAELRFRCLAAARAAEELIGPRHNTCTCPSSVTEHGEHSAACPEHLPPVIADCLVQR